MEFLEFRKIPRLSREIIITEKIDGTNGQIAIFKREDISQEDLDSGKYPYMSVGMEYVILAGSRTKWVDIKNDNAGFGRWVSDNREELLKLGEGRHFGEWWGQKIQRGYNLKEKRFSLFNTSKWTSGWNLNGNFGDNLCLEVHICDVVPVLYKGDFNTVDILNTLMELNNRGSFASPGFMNPEGIVIYHTAGNLFFKKTIVNDESPKGLVK